MSEYTFTNVFLDGISGSFLVNDVDILFTTSEVIYKWPLTSWIRSEKSKKTPKVRLTFKERPIRLTAETSESDSIVKEVVVVDFLENREKLDEFCDLIANLFNKSRQTVPDVQVTQEVSEVTSEKTQSEVSVGSKTVVEDFDKTKKTLLDSNEHLMKLYNSLISQSTEYQGLITSKDFWEHHKLDLLAKQSQPLARSNLEGFVSVPPASTVVNSQNVYNYSKELTDALLAEDETISNLYNKLVKEKKFPEENFWKRILQSRYFYNLIGEKIPENQILYEDIKGIPIKRTKKKLDTKDVLKISDSSSELITIDDSKKTFRNKKFVHYNKRFGKTFGSEHTKELLVQRFNLHSYKIIKESQSKTCNISTDSSTVDDPVLLETQAENNRKRKLLDSTQEDLQERDEQDYLNNLCVISSLTLPGQLEQQPHAVVKSESSESVNKIQLKLKYFPSFGDNTQWINDLKNFNITQYIKDSKIDDLVSRRMFVLNTKLCQSEKLMQLVQFEYDPTTVSRMKEIQQEIIEVLQMYYKTLMPEESKRGRLLTILRVIKQKIESLNDSSMSSHTVKTLQSSLLDQITAVEAYDMKLRSYVSSLRSQRTK